MNEPFSKEELAELNRMVARGERVDFEEVERRIDYNHRHSYDYKDEGCSNTFFIAGIALAIALLALAATLMSLSN